MAPTLARRLGHGGRLIHVETTNGGLHIGSD